MARIAFFELERWEKEIIQKKLARHDVRFFSQPLSTRILPKIKNVEVLVVFVGSNVDEQIIGALPKLKHVATMSTGFDHIDLHACKASGITVSNVPFYGENTVAEHVFALLLGLSRKLPEAVDKTRNGNFSWTGLRGFDLRGKKIGVIGTGHIGMHTIQIALGFGMKVLAFDIRKNFTHARKLGFSYVTLNKLLKESDVVSLHLPYNPHTKHILDKDKLALMKKGSYLINTARGGLIDTSALLKALNRGQIAGAGLDVLEEEGALREGRFLVSDKYKGSLKVLLEDHILAHHPRVIMTPHTAFNTTEALIRILDTTVENITGNLHGRKINLVN